VVQVDACESKLWKPGYRLGQGARSKPGCFQAVGELVQDVLVQPSPHHAADQDVLLRPARELPVALVLSVLRHFRKSPTKLPYPRLGLQMCVRYRRVQRNALKANDMGDWSEQDDSSASCVRERVCTAVHSCASPLTVDDGALALEVLLIQHLVHGERLRFRRAQAIYAAHRHRREQTRCEEPRHRA
jgi:hypothetical protein